MQRFKRIGFTVGLVTVWLAGCVAAHAMASGVTFEIAAGSAPTTLKEFAAQAHVQLLFDYKAVQSLKTPAIKGQLEPTEALKILLQGSGLTFRQVNDRTIALMAVGSEPSTSSTVPTDQASGIAAAGEGRSSSSQGFRVAQADQGAPANTPSVANQSPNNAPFVLQEVIVTAQKREERLIDVPISIVALSAGELKNRQITTLEDLPSAVPGLAIQSNGANRSIVLRGISNTIGASGADMPLIGLYLDEADVTLGAFYQINPSTYDLDRVEVLRGPQGTLYGEGSAGGTIRFITKNPDLTKFVFNSDVAALFTQDGAPSQRINATVNVPLIENQLALRIVGTFDHEGGWIDQPAADQKDINGQNLTNVRAKALWRPTQQFTVSALVQIYRNDLSTGTGEDPNGNFTQVFNLTTTPRIRDEHEIYNVTLKYDFGSAEILNTTSYVSVTNDSQNTGFHYQYTDPTLPPPSNLPYDYLALRNLLDDRVLENELRVISTGNGPWRWTVGGLYRHFHDDFEYPVAYSGQPGPPGTPLPAPPFSYQSSYLFKDWSVFGDTSYKLTDRLTLGAGVRYFKDDQEFEANASGFGSNQAGTFHSVDPRVYAQYKLTESANLYASAAKGFRSGGFNFVPGTPTFEPENVWTYELGAKTAMLNDRVRADVAIFYSTYKNYQVNGISPPPNDIFGVTTSNAGDARIKGIEANISWHPSDQWTLGFNGDYLDTRFYKINAASTAYQVGDPLDGVPRYQFGVTGQRDFVWQDRAGFLRLDYNQQGRKDLRNRSIGPWYFSQSDVINMLNLNASLWWSKNLRLGVFGQNLLNDRGFLSAGSIELNAARARPRTFGFEVGVSFD